MDSWSSFVCCSPKTPPPSSGWYVATTTAAVASRPGGSAFDGETLDEGERVFVTEGAGTSARLFRGGWVEASALAPEVSVDGVATSKVAKGPSMKCDFARDFDAELNPDMGDLVRTNSIGPPPGRIAHYDGYAAEAGWFAPICDAPVLEKNCKSSGVVRALAAGGAPVFVVLFDGTTGLARLLAGGWCAATALAPADARPPPARAAFSEEDDGEKAGAVLLPGWYSCEGPDGAVEVFVTVQLPGGAAKLYDGTLVEAASLTPIATVRRSSSILAAAVAARD